MNNLTGKIALVTGGSRGIGREIALVLAAAGLDVAVNFRKQPMEAEAVCSKVADAGRRALAVQGDVSSASDIQAMVEEVETKLGPVSVLINNAGIARSQPLDRITERDWDEIVDTNLKSCFLAIQAILPGMRSRKWGRIVNISSVAAQIGGIVGPHYAASKAGMLGLTHYYASALAKEGITVNAVSPALIETDMLKGSTRAKPELIPIGRFGTAAETADAVLLLVGNGYMTGQTIQVNGGMYMT